MCWKGNVHAGARSTGGSRSRLAKYEPLPLCLGVRLISSLAAKDPWSGSACADARGHDHRNLGAHSMKARMRSTIDMAAITSAEPRRRQSPQTRRARISPAHSAAPFGSRSSTYPIGAGCWSAATAPGIRPCGSSASARATIGTARSPPWPPRWAHLRVHERTGVLQILVRDRVR